MTDSARARIFASVRSACAGADAEKIERELASFGRAPSASLPAADICTAFLVNVLKNQGSVDCVPNRSGAVKAVAEYLYEHFRSLRLVAGNDPHLAAMPWREAGVLPRFGTVEAGEPVTLSYALLGVAEIGGIVTLTGKANPAANMRTRCGVELEEQIALTHAAPMSAIQHGCEWIERQTLNVVEGH